MAKRKQSRDWKEYVIKEIGQAKYDEYVESERLYLDYLYDLCASEAFKTYSYFKIHDIQDASEEAYIYFVTRYYNDRFVTIRRFVRNKIYSLLIDQTKKNDARIKYEEVHSALYEVATENGLSDLLKKEMIERINDALANITEDCRIFLALSILDGLSVREIRELTGKFLSGHLIRVCKEDFLYQLKRLGLIEDNND